jgi:uncharacterized membrane protein YdjX (TVP38/TMEM64 family)
VFVAIAGAAVLLSHVTPIRHTTDMESMRALAIRLGWRGPLLVWAAACVSPLLLLPRWPIAMLCGTLYGVAGGTLLATAASTTGAWIHFTLARKTLSPLATRWQDQSWIRLLLRHTHRAFPAILILRAVPFTSSVATNLLAGSLRVRHSTFLAATFLGMLPSSLMYAAWGKLLKKPSPTFYALAIALLLAITLAAFLVRQWLLHEPAEQKNNNP